MTNMNKFVYGRQKKSKYAIFYTAYNNVEQLQLSSEFFNKSKFLCENFDIVINCNSPVSHEKMKSVAQFFAAKKIVVLCDLVNDGAYLMGPPEQAAHSFDELLGYDLVLHLHPDVYIISDHGLQNFISDFTKTDPQERDDYYTFPMHPTLGLPPGQVRINEYASDGWIVCPKPTNNIFSTWSEYTEDPSLRTHPTRPAYAEGFLYDELHRAQLKVGLFDRAPCAGMKNEYEEASGLMQSTNLHTHGAFNKKD